MATQNNIAVQNTTKVGLVILSVLFPIVGYILYFAKKAEEPEAAHSCLISAIAGSVVGVLMMI